MKAIGKGASIKKSHAYVSTLDLVRQATASNASHNNNTAEKLHSWPGVNTSLRKCPLVTMNCDQVITGRYTSIDTSEPGPFMRPITKITDTSPAAQAARPCRS